MKIPKKKWRWLSKKTKTFKSSDGWTLESLGKIRVYVPLKHKKVR